MLTSAGHLLHWSWQSSVTDGSWFVVVDSSLSVLCHAFFLTAVPVTYSDFKLISTGRGSSFLFSSSPVSSNSLGLIIFITSRFLLLPSATLWQKTHCIYHVIVEIKSHILCCGCPLFSGNSVFSMASVPHL